MLSSESLVGKILRIRTVTGTKSIVCCGAELRDIGLYVKSAYGVVFCVETPVFTPTSVDGLNIKIEVVSKVL